MTDPLTKQWFILRMIPKYPRKIGTREIKNRLLTEHDIGTTIRTVQRDLNYLSGVGCFPISNDSNKPNGWFWDKDAEVMDLPGMDPQTAMTFRLANEFLSKLLPKATLKYLKPHFDRADEVFRNIPKNKYAKWVSKVRVVPDWLPLPPPEIKTKTQEAVYEALLEGKRLEITYKKPNQKTNSYDIDPLALVFRGRVTYLVCSLWDYDDIKHLAMHRIKKATMLDKKMRIPKGFNLDEHISVKEMFHVPLSDKKIRLRAIFHGYDADHLKESPLSKDQKLTKKNNGSVLLEATVKSTSQLRWWLMGFGDAVEVLGPKALRNEFAKMAKRLESYY